MVGDNLEVPPLLPLLAHEVRWRLLHALAISDYRVQELVEQLGRPLNLVSYHLKQLRHGQLVIERRSSADARDVYYHLDMERLQTLYHASGAALHPALARETGIDQSALVAPHQAPVRILFLCTHNSARSQMAEGIARTFGGDWIEVYSAGSEPSVVHPDAVHTLANMQIDISRQVSKHLDQFSDRSFDYIITLCDQARETCPAFPNNPTPIHWSLPDPSAITDDQARAAQFQAIARELITRMRYFLTIIDRKQPRS